MEIVFEGNSNKLQMSLTEFLQSCFLLSFIELNIIVRQIMYEIE